MASLDGDIDENDKISLNDLVYLEAYSSGNSEYTINENKIYNIAIQNENFDSNNGEHPYVSQAIDVMKKYIIGEGSYQLQPEPEPQPEPQPEPELDFSNLMAKTPVLRKDASELPTAGSGAIYNFDYSDSLTKL